MDLNRRSSPVKLIVQTSLLIALAIVIRNFSYMVYFGGAGGMRISFSGVFTKIAAILGGPLFGGAASGIVDIIGFLLRPEGAFIPWLTVTAVLGGVITGALWMLARKIDAIKLQNIFLVLSVIIGLLGIINYITIAFLSDSIWAQTIARLGKYKDFASLGLVVAAIIGIAFILSGIAVKKMHKKSEIHDDFLKVLLVTAVGGIIVTTLNTWILQLFVPSLGKMGFLVFWIPRVIQEVLMTVIQAYIISLLLAIYRKNFGK